MVAPDCLTISAAVSYTHLVWGGGFLGDNLYILDSGVDIVGQRLFQFVALDFSLVIHVLQDDLALLRVGFLTRDGVEFGRVLGESR